MSYPRTCVLLSALKSLTSVFGMGTGVASLPSSLDPFCLLGVDLPKLDIFLYFRVVVGSMLAFAVRFPIKPHSLP